MKNFECAYCKTGYVRESAFMKHECKQMLRAKEIQTPVGQSAYSIYCKWMRSYNRNAPNIQVFLTSKYYTNFIKISKYFVKVNIVDIDMFIRLMKMKELGPNLWLRDDVYSLYLDFVDRLSDPYDMVKLSINELMDISEEYSCDVSDVFSHVSTSEILDLIRQRRLSPWLLLRSAKFKQLLIQSTTEETSIFENLIKPAYWSYKFKQHPEVLTAVKMCVSELGL